MYGWDHTGWMFGNGGGWMIFGWFWMALIGLVPILLLFALVKYLFGIGNPVCAPRKKRAGQRWIFWMKLTHAGI